MTPAQVEDDFITHLFKLDQGSKLYRINPNNCWWPLWLSVSTLIGLFSIYTSAAVLTGRTGLCWCLMEGVTIKQSSSRDWSHVQWFTCWRWLRLPVNPQSADGCFHPSANSRNRLLWCGGHRGSDGVSLPHSELRLGVDSFLCSFWWNICRLVVGLWETKDFLLLWLQQNVLTEKIVGTLTNPDISVVSDLTHTLQVVWLLRKKLCFWTWLNLK